MERFPARRITIPEGYTLTSEEVVRILEVCDARKKAGDPGFDVEATSPEWYTLRVPIGVALTASEINVVLTRANQAKEGGNADLLFTWSDGNLVKPGWVTLKHGPHDGKLRIAAGDTRSPRGF